MAKANYGEEMEKAPAMGGTNDWFKAEEGQNRMRLLSTSAICAKHFSQTGYKGICIGVDDNCPGCKEGTKPSIKHLVWILDRKDDKMKLYNMPHKAFQQIVAYQKDPEWAFSDVPMPYDINLHAKNAGSTDVVYTIIPSPKQVPLEEAELAEVEKLTPTDIIVEKMKDKERKAVSGEAPSKPVTNLKNPSGLPETIEYPADEINLDDIPF